MAKIKQNDRNLT